MIKFILKEAVKAQKGIRGIALLFLSLRFYSRERNPLPIVQEVGWAAVSLRTGAKYVALHRNSIRGPSCP
jgi:hypothetical protein